MKSIYTLFALPLLLLLFTGCEKEGCGCQNFGFEMNGSQTKVFAPSAFTPDTNGINDVYRVSAVQVSDFQLIIQYGNETVFQTTDPLAGWDGSHNGNAAATGEYRVFLDFRDAGGNTVDKTFRMMLYRQSVCGLPAEAAAPDYWFLDQVDPNAGRVNETQESFCTQ